jgi:serine/threonine-protein kinase
VDPSSHDQPIKNDRDTSLESDEELAGLLSELADRVARGEVVDFDKVCRENPEIADDLRYLWGAVLVTDAAGTSVNEIPGASQTAFGTSGQDAGSSGDGDQAARWRTMSLPTTIGDYRLEEELGRGGMGVVFRATQISLGRSVAVKMILRGRLASHADLKRFLAEASATARLQHPNIVPVYDVGDIDGRPFFSMQLIHGETLADRLIDGPLSEAAAARIIASAARAIGYAHRQGILHRDLKPSNILLDKAGKPHVSDFGLAKQGGEEPSLTRSGAVLGTPAYMSPEQASGSRTIVGPATDIYSLGCVLYHALTGRPPLVSDSPVELVLMVLEQDPPPPRTLRPNLDRVLEMIVVRCLQKPVDLRYETADELADDLEAFLNDEHVAASEGRFGQVVARLFRETHHAAVLENWGLLWMWHSLILLVACLATWTLELYEVQNRFAYATLWIVGLGTWAAVFWVLRRRMGPVTFVERQIAHVWAASMLGIAMLFPLEWWLGLAPLKLSPILGILAAMVFLVKAGMFSGAFYIQAAALSLTAVAMAAFPRWNHLVFGVVSAACFFFPGLKYYRRRKLR